MVDCDKVLDAADEHGALYVGAHPEPGVVLQAYGITMLVLTSKHHQDASQFRGLRVVKAPLEDDAFCIVAGDEKRAETAAIAVVEELQRGGNVLVTCKEGMNRSAWVAAWAIVKLRGCSGSEAVAEVQCHRPGSLYNWFFRDHILRLNT